MPAYKITFLLNGKEYEASVKQADNIYTVQPLDDSLRQQFNEVTLLEAHGEFAWPNYSPEFYQFALTISVALKEYI